NHEYDVIHSMVPLVRADVYQPRGGSVLYSARRHCRSFDSKFKQKFKQATMWMNRARQVRIRAEAELCRSEQGSVVAALSDYVAGQFKDEYDLPSERLRVIANGIDVDRCNLDEAQAAGKKLRRQFDKNDDLAIFIFAAQNQRLKGLSNLIRAGQHVLEQKTSERDFRILVFSGWEYERYWRQADQLGLNQRVIFMGATERLIEMLQMCDGVVLPSFNDACSRVILEGLAAGKPGITTRYNGAAELLGEGKYGFVVEDGDDVKGLAEAMLSLCDRRRHQEMCEAIEKDKVVEQVSIRRHVRQLVELFQEIAGKK
ncbi:MAG: glycosyltransferase family 4 protein, partial [Planctomycetes bacterium]|nr:glycosyltransferase family 4 protein [Planctomycetota bacterium]